MKFAIDTKDLDGVKDKLQEFVKPIHDGTQKIKDSFTNLTTRLVAGFQLQLEKVKNRVNYAKNKFLQILPHAFIAFGTFLFRNPIIAGLTTFASRLGLVAASAFITPITVVLTAVGLSAAFNVARNRFKRSKAESYEAKTDVQLKELSADHVKAFLDGVEAQKSYTAQAKTCFSFNDYRHGNAFFAGMGAQAENKNELIEKIKQRQPQA